MFKVLPMDNVEAMEILAVAFTDGLSRSSPCWFLLLTCRVPGAGLSVVGFKGVIGASRTIFDGIEVTACL